MLGVQRQSPEPPVRAGVCSPYKRKVTPHATASFLVAASLLAAAPAAAQTIPPPGPPALTYTQPLAPQAVQMVQGQLNRQGVYSGRVRRRLGSRQPSGPGAFPADAWAASHGPVEPGDDRDARHFARPTADRRAPGSSGWNCRPDRRKHAEQNRDPGDSVSPGRAEFLPWGHGWSLGAVRPSRRSNSSSRGVGSSRTASSTRPRLPPWELTRASLPHNR